MCTVTRKFKHQNDETYLVLGKLQGKVYTFLIKTYQYIQVHTNIQIIWLLVLGHTRIYWHVPRYNWPDFVQMVRILDATLECQRMIV